MNDARVLAVARMRRQPSIVPWTSRLTVCSSRCGWGCTAIPAFSRTSVGPFTSTWSARCQSDRLGDELGQFGQAVLPDGLGRQKRDHGHPARQ